jgi:hypothetical protein
MPTNPNTVKLIWIFTAILLPLIPALLLFMLLPRSKAEVSGPFRGLQIKLGGAVGAYFLLVLVISFGPRPSFPPPYEVWTIKGYIQDENGTYLPPDKINMEIQPRSVEYLNDGSFEMDVLVKRGQSGRVKFPALMVNWQPAQLFGNAAVHLDPAGQLFGKKYKLKVDQDSREIEVDEPIQLKRTEQEKPYAPAEPPPKPTVLPASATPSNTP